ncbi:MAG: AbrB/MazE/SpoVT family DNA-binding domain-containing protein [Planctomycetaceae bacterium]|nr:AbrB/MazE/SpoVT family DNA-binding domain-containing protein [Planctomycetaceae bacterium]
MKTQVQKWGNSLAVRIPKAFADETGLQQETPVEMTVEEGGLVVRPVRGPQVSLADLLEKVTPDNLHGEVDFGPAVGREIW